MAQLLVLLYHRIGIGKHSNSLEMLKKHLQYIKNHYAIVLPGDPLEKKKLSICLTFDDATYDFYHFAYPILKELNIRALLGVPVRYILNSTHQIPQIRLNVPYPLMMQDGIFEIKAPFCTWQELDEMVRSGHVEVASHSLSHPNLTFPFVKWEREIFLSKQILEHHLPQAITSFIYPFGKNNVKIEAFVKEHYQYSFRIGSAMNFGWENRKALCRVPADNLLSAHAPFTFWNQIHYYIKNFL